MPAEFDPYAESYDRILADAIGMAGDLDRFAVYKIEEIAYRLRRERVRRVLDFGCGVGRSLPLISAAFPGAEVWGFDPSIESIKEVHQRERRARVTADWNEIPTGQFDCIVAANVFHHIAAEERVGEMRRCAASLAPGGSLFVFEHNPINPLTRLVFERCPFDRHATMISRKEMLQLGALASLRVRVAAFTLFLPFSGRLVGWLHRRLAWLPLGAQYYVQFIR